MLQEKIEADPDVEMAIESVIEAGLMDSLEHAVASAGRARPGSAGETNARRYIRELMVDIGGTASRAGLSGEALVDLIRARRTSRPRSRAAQDLRILQDRYVAAIAAETDAVRELTAAQQKCEQAQRARRAAEADYKTLSATSLGGQ